MNDRRGWAQAIAEIGRIDKTIHTLNFIDDEARRRGTLLQLNLGEGRHSLRAMCFMANAASCSSATAWDRKTS